MFEVRPLTIQYFDTFAAVVEEINEQSLDLETCQQLKRDFNTGCYVGFLLYEETTLAGIGIVVDSYSAVHARKVLYLDELYIREPFRRKGLGKVLFEHIIDHAKVHGYMRLEWLAEKGNTPAEALYSQYETDTDRTWYGLNL